MAPENKHTPPLDPASCTPRVHSCLLRAKQRADAGHPVGVEHLALAVIEGDEGLLDQTLGELFDGLLVRTLVEVLGELIDLEADDTAADSSAIAGGGEDPPGIDDLAAPAREVLQHARELADGWKIDALSHRALLVALLTRPSELLLEAFAIAGVAAPRLAALVEVLTRDETATASAGEVFAQGQLDPDRFAPLARQALLALSGLASATRPLRDVDLLLVLLRQESSRLAQGLALQHISRAGLERQLVRLGGERESRAPSGQPLCDQYMSGLLRRVFERAASLAAQDHAATVTESHLVRAHLERVTSTADNLYERAGIDPARLRRYLEKYFTDTTAERTGPTGPSDLGEFLRSRVLHQEAAITRVVPALKRMRSGLGEPGRPLGVFLFLGPTGVGKTELAKAMATAAFADDPTAKPPLIHIDCGRFATREDIVQLIGARQGLVGYKEGHLSNALGDHPESVILFDEVEKAHPDIWQSLLGLFDEGRLQEPDGTEHDATRSILVATSNQGYREAIERHDPFTGTNDHERERAWQAVEREVEDTLREYFSPELLGRIGRRNRVFFRHFSEAAYLDLMHQQTSSLAAEMQRHGLSVAVDDEVVELLAALAWRQREDGARPVRELIKQHLRDPLVDAREADPGRATFSFTALRGSEQVLLRPLPEEG